MPHTFVSNLVHCVFSTKERRKTIAAELQPKLWTYMGGIARGEGLKALAIGGTDDHAHLLLSVPTTVLLANAMQHIKGNSSKWVHDTFPSTSLFGWQQGYGCFSIGISQVDETVAYIESQPEHHKKRSFEEEFVAFLKKHGIEYDERYIWE